MRTLLFLTTLSLLVLPTGDRASAQDVTAGEMTGAVEAGNAVSCAPEPPAPESLSHVRCATGAGEGFLAPAVQLVATRNLPVPDVEICTGDVADIPFTTRETVAEGRGRIGPITITLTAADNHPCDVDLEGRFHRVGTVATGRLTVRIHVQRPGEPDFQHRYCARFDATAVPVANQGTLVVAAVEGRQGNCLLPEAQEDILHGRLPGDGNDPLHHDTLVLPSLP